MIYLVCGGGLLATSIGGMAARFVSVLTSVMISFGVFPHNFRSVSSSLSSSDIEMR